MLSLRGIPMLCIGMTKQSINAIEDCFAHEKHSLAMTM